MDYHNISSQRNFKSTTFGTEEDMTFMSVRHTPIAEATYLSRLPLVARPARQSLMDVIHSNSHQTDKELIASSAMNLGSHQEAKDLLAHMAEVQEEVVDEITLRLRELERDGFGAEVGKLDDDITCFDATHDLDEDAPGCPPDFPRSIWNKKST
jgi:hypothetical protein